VRLIKEVKTCERKNHFVAKLVTDGVKRTAMAEVTLDVSQNDVFIDHDHATPLPGQTGHWTLDKLTRA